MLNSVSQMTSLVDDTTALADRVNAGVHSPVTQQQQQVFYDTDSTCGRRGAVSDDMGRSWTADERTVEPTFPVPLCDYHQYVRGQRHLWMSSSSSSCDHPVTYSDLNTMFGSFRQLQTLPAAATVSSQPEDQDNFGGTVTEVVTPAVLSDCE